MVPPAPKYENTYRDDSAPGHLVRLLIDSGRRGLQHWLLRPGLRLHAYVDPLHIESMLASFYAAPQTGKRGYTVSMLLTFSAWLERFGGREAAER